MPVAKTKPKTGATKTTKPKSKPRLPALDELIDEAVASMPGKLASVKAYPSSGRVRVRTHMGATRWIKMPKGG